MQSVLVLRKPEEGLNFIREESYWEELSNSDKAEALM